MRIFSWNVNGIRAVIRKGAFQDFVAEYQPDILCLQETKAKQGQAEIDLPEYEEIWNSAEKPGYSGTAIFTKIKPMDIIDDFKIDFRDSYGDLNKEGRVQIAEFDNFYLVNVYTPNSKPDLSRLRLRENNWDPEFLKLLEKLRESKPVVTCGDFNAAHEEMDLARPNANHHNAGFTDEERKGISNIINAGFVDTFRFLHPDSERYTWWSHWGNARANNIGWRIDYFFISDSLKARLKSAEIYESVFGSDHCPISVELDFDEESAAISSDNRDDNADEGASGFPDNRDGEV